MRKLNSIPRVIKINRKRGFKISVAFNNGEHRIINFENLFEKWKTEGSSFWKPLLKAHNFRKVVLKNNTLCWESIKRKLKLSNEMEFDVELEIDPSVLYEFSEPDEKLNKRYKVGELLKSERIKAGLTQEELAIRSGTTKNYISRIENNKSDIELGTFRKIIEIGLDRKLEIAISE